MSPAVEEILTAVSSVHDPEYPGISVTDLGLLETIDLQGDRASISMIPTYGGCPALGFIADDVKEAVEALDGVSTCEVRWLRSPVWTQDRVSEDVIRVLEQEFTVTLRRRDGSLVCPVCGSGTVRDTAPMGPSRCRSLAFCDDCRNPIEVMR
ncbi:MAG: iron-sulfur cluster assembly protein [Acidimicrobiales bacterium]